MPTRVTRQRVTEAAIRRRIWAEKRSARRHWFLRLAARLGGGKIGERRAAFLIETGRVG